LGYGSMSVARPLCLPPNYCWGMSFELVPDPKMQYALGFVATVGATGVVSSKDLVAYVEDATSPHDALGIPLRRIHMIVGGDSARGTPDRLRRLGWAAGDPIVATELGLRVWDELQKSLMEDESDALTEVYLDREDPLAFVRLKREIAMMEGGVFVVDPYFKMEQLEALADVKSLKRVLISDKLKPAQKSALADACETLGLDIEIRVA